MKIREKKYLFIFSFIILVSYEKIREKLDSKKDD